VTMVPSPTWRWPELAAWPAKMTPRPVGGRTGEAGLSAEHGVGADLAGVAD